MNLKIIFLKFILLFICIIQCSSTNKDISNIFENIDEIELNPNEIEELFSNATRLLDEVIDRDDVTLSLRYEKMLTQRIGSDFWEFCDPGIINCTCNESIYIKSHNFPVYPPGYPANMRMIWDIMVDPSCEMVELRCPIISTRFDQRCKNDFIKVKWGPNFIFGGRRYCGQFVNFVKIVEGPMRIIFKTNYDELKRLGFICQITCLPFPSTTTIMTTTPTTTPTTTTFMPGCAEEPICSLNPIVVDSCDDMVIPAHCTCIQCSGAIAIYCDICTPCDLELFSSYVFTVPVHLGITCLCPSNDFMVIDYMCGNQNMILQIEYCIGEDGSCIDYKLYANVSIVFYMVCDGCYDTCTNYHSCSRSNNVQGRIDHKTKVLKSEINHQRNITNQKGRILSVISEICHNGKCAKNIEICSETIESQSYIENEAMFYKLKFILPCTKELEDNFLTTGDNSNVDTVEFVIDSSKMAFIANAIVLLLEDFQVVVKYTSSEPSCDQCENKFLWDNLDKLDNLDAKCNGMQIKYHVQNNDPPNC